MTFVRSIIHMIMLLGALVVETQAADPSLLGTFSRVQVAASDLQASLAWYARMGFLPVKTPMDRADSVVTVSDGQTTITLVNAMVPSPVMVFGTQNVKWLFDTLTAMEIKVNVDVRGPTYRELRLTSPDGIYLLVRPISEEREVPKPNGTLNTMCGKHTELSIGLMRLMRERAWWQDLGFTVKNEDTTPYHFCLMTDGNVVVGLHHDRDIPQLSFTYFAPDMRDRIAILRRLGIEPFDTIEGDDGKPDHAFFRSPEGTVFMLFTGDQ